jgi:hypothetical protein
VSLHQLGIATSSNLEDDFATKSLVESIDEKLLWPIYFVRVSHKFSRSSAFLCCLAHVIDINSLAVLGGNASTAREKTSLKEGNCDCWRTGFWGGHSSFRGVASGVQLTGPAEDCKTAAERRARREPRPAVQFIPHVFTV